jgi:hypothetical protein
LVGSDLAPDDQPEKNFPGTNSLAYFGLLSMAKKKFFEIFTSPLILSSAVGAFETDFRGPGKKGCVGFHHMIDGSTCDRYKLAGFALF